MRTFNGKSEKEVEEILKFPFEENDIEWRIASSWEQNGDTCLNVLAYITSRAVMERLDLAFGCLTWQLWHPEGASSKPGDPVICTISVKADDGTSVERTGVGEVTDFEAAKGGASDAVKRAAVLFGIGRYLYSLPRMVVVAKKGKKGKYESKVKIGNSSKWVSWDPPKLDKEFLPHRDITEAQKKELQRFLKSHTIPNKVKARIENLLIDGDKKEASTAIDYCKNLESTIRDFEAVSMYPKFLKYYKDKGEKKTKTQIMEEVRQNMIDEDIVNRIDIKEWLNWDSANLSSDPLVKGLKNKLDELGGTGGKADDGN